MLGEKQTAVPVNPPIGPRLQFVAQQALLEEFLLQPQRDGHLERAQTARREGDIGLEQTLELQERLVIEDDVVHLIETHAFLGQTIVDGMGGKAGVVLFTAESLLLRGGDNLAVADPGSRAVMVKSGNA